MVSKRFLAFFVLISICQLPTVSAQSQLIDSLRIYLEVHFELKDQARVDMLNKVAFLCYPDNSPDVKKFSQLALQLSQNIGYKSGMAAAYRNQGLYSASCNADPVALSLYDRSYQLSREIGDHQGASQSLNAMGDYYGRLKDSKSQLYFYQMAYKEIPHHLNSHYEGILLAGIGLANENSLDFEGADLYYNKVLDMAIEIKDKELQVISYRHLASVNFSLGNYLIALDLVNKGLGIVQDDHNYSDRYIGEMDNLLGKIYFVLKDFGKSSRYLTTSMDIARRLKNNESVCQNYYDLYRLDSTQGNYKAAISSFILYKKMADSVQNAATDQRLAKFQIQFKMERNLAENKLLIKEGEHSKTVIALQAISLALLIVGMVVIGTGLFYLNRTNKQVESKNAIIKKQNDNLENINLVKDKLFSVVSHDLRGPILQVKGLLNLFQAGNVSDEELLMLTPKVQENLDKTLELVDNLLIWSKNQMQGFKLRPSEFLHAKVVQENIRYFESQLLTKHISIRNELLPDELIFADREMINIVFRNLLSNAIKFTFETGTIRIFSYKTETSVVVGVEDSGVGVKEENIDKIFAFVNYSTPGTLNEKGSGVGLKLCKDLIELNSGTIWYEPKTSGGSVFLFSLPLISTEA